MQYIKAYFGFLLAFLVADALWITLVIRDFYQAEVGQMLRASPNMAAAGIFYLFYAAGAVLLAIKPATRGLGALALGAVLGALTYGTFTVTNYAMLDGWTVTLAVSDVIWGAFLTGISSGAGYQLGKTNLSSETAV